MPMSPRDTIDMMRRCAQEIRALRARVAYLEPKAEAYDAIRTILGLLPQPAECFSEDLAHRLEKEAEQLWQEIMPRPKGSDGDTPNMVM